jgi:NAD(P)-dependent dehydrogenase (short-subunit alcohol dehydrogenase family)
LNEEALKATTAEIEALGAKVISSKVNTVDLPAVQAAAKEAHDHFGRLDGACNGAAIGSPENKKIGEIDDEAFDRVLRINVVGTKNCVKSQVQYLKKGASVVNIASASGLFGEWGATA